MNYPYDTSLRHPHADTNENEDVNAFKKISRDFVKLHKTLLKQEPCMYVTMRILVGPFLKG